MLGEGGRSSRSTSRWRSKKQADEIYAVEPTINAKAERDSSVMFNVELAAGGVYRIKNICRGSPSPCRLPAR